MTVQSCIELIKKVFYLLFSKETFLHSRKSSEDLTKIHLQNKLPKVLMRSDGLLIPKNNQLNWKMLISCKLLFLKIGFKVMSQIFIFTIIVELYSWVFRNCKTMQPKHSLIETEMESVFFVSKFNFFCRFRLWCIICKLFLTMSFMCFFGSIHSS